jgi:hypothetical protein
MGNYIKLFINKSLYLCFFKHTLKKVKYNSSSEVKSAGKNGYVSGQLVDLTLIKMIPAARFPGWNYHVQTIARLHAFLAVYLSTTMSRPLTGCMLSCLSICQLRCSHCQCHCPAGRFPACLSANYVQNTAQLHASCLSICQLPCTLYRPLPGCMLSCLSICQLSCPGHCPAACFPVCLSANYPV